MSESVPSFSGRWIDNEKNVWLLHAVNESFELKKKDGSKSGKVSEFFVTIRIWSSGRDELWWSVVGRDSTVARW